MNVEQLIRALSNQMVVLQTLIFGTVGKPKGGSQ